MAGPDLSRDLLTSERERVLPDSFPPADERNLAGDVPRFTKQEVKLWFYA